MLTMIGKRLMFAIPSLIGVVIVTFLLTRALPGDPAGVFRGPAATKEAVEQIRKKLGLDKPLIEQFFRYTNDLAPGDFGNSLTTASRSPPRSATACRLGRVDAAGPLRVGHHRHSARRARRHPAGLVDRSSLPDHDDGRRVAAGVLYRSGAGLRLLFQARLVAGAARPARCILQRAADDNGLLSDRHADRARFRGVSFRAQPAALPAATLAIFSLAPIARMTRASMLAVLASDFVRTARASGLSPSTVIVTYAFRNAMLPVITTLSMVFSFLLGANVLVEKVFAWPGIGSYAVEALISSDFAPVQGFVLTMAVMYVLLNLVIDILYGVIDPRVRLEG
jgi:peptide/nickel transport system permease protein